MATDVAVWIAQQPWLTSYSTVLGGCQMWHSSNLRQHLAGGTSKVWWAEQRLRFHTILQFVINSVKSVATKLIMGGIPSAPTATLEASWTKINANPVKAATKQWVSGAFYVPNFTTYQIQPGLTWTGLSGLTWIWHALLNQLLKQTGRWPRALRIYRYIIRPQIWFLKINVEACTLLTKRQPTETSAYSCNTDQQHPQRTLARTVCLMHNRQAAPQYFGLFIDLLWHTLFIPDQNCIHTEGTLGNICAGSQGVKYNMIPLWPSWYDKMLESSMQPLWTNESLTAWFCLKVLASSALRKGARGNGRSFEKQQWRKFRRTVYFFLSAT